MSGLPDRLRRVWGRHPILRQVLLWSVPALLLGAVLRAMLLSYSPYAFWGSDSMSYYGFSFELLARHMVSYGEKRRYLYPVVMLLVSLLPGSPLQWTAWVQHGLGLLSILPLGYSVRRIFPHWRWLILAVTCAYAAMPVNLWYEHELIGESLFFACMAWAFGGWVAWSSEENPLRARRLWWWFYVPLALLILTKPSAKFLWPGLVAAGFIMHMRRPWCRSQSISLAALFLVSLTVGQKSQGDRLLYTTAFPLTRLETPLHADYKAEIRDLVVPLRAEIDRYYALESEEFLRSPEKELGRPLWAHLGRISPQKFRLYHDLAIEGIKARPDLFLAISLQRIVGSANEGQGKPIHFNATSYARRFRPLYEVAAAEKPDLMRMLFHWPKGMPLPPFAEAEKLVSPKPASGAAVALERWAELFSHATRWAEQADGNERINRPLRELRPTAFAWLLIASALLSLRRCWRASLFAWVLIGASYLVGVFLVGSCNTRYFAPVWPIVTVLIGAPFDLLLSGAQKAFRAAFARFTPTTLATAEPNV